MNMGHERGERNQQLSLLRAMQDTLHPSNFASDISQLTSLIPPGLDVDDSPQHGTCSKATIFISTATHSGRRSLEVLQMAHLDGFNNQNGSLNTIIWLQSIWALIDQSMDPGADTVPLPPTGDPWLNDHVISMISDLLFASGDHLQ
jgi:hypothetical protein